MFKTMSKAVLGLLVNVCLLCVPMYPQETRASLSGSVTDGSGAVIAGASVPLTNTATAVASRPNQSGQYRFLFLNPGKYKVSAEIAGALLP